MNLMKDNRKVMPILTGVGVVLGLCLSILLYFISPTTPVWFYIVTTILLSTVGHLVGRFQDSRIRTFNVLQENLSSSNQDLQSLVEENKASIEKLLDTEAKISNAKKTWETIFDAVNDLIILTDPQNTIIRCNRATIEALNTSFKELLGQEFNTVFSCTDGSSPQIETNLQFKNIPGWFTMSSFSVALVDNQQATVFIIRDISIEHAANNEIIRQKEFFEALVKNSPVAIVIMNMESSIISCNPAFEVLYGYQQEEVIGKNLDLLISKNADFEEADKYSRNVAQGKTVHGYGQRIRKDGSQVDVEIFGVPVIVDGKGYGILGIYHDVTEILQARRDAEAVKSVHP
jgi:two-component system sensor histidine kinase/response regulator